MLKSALCAFLLVIGACTFPDVDYADGGAGTTTSSGATTNGTPCPAEQGCASDASKCATTANNTDKSCDKKCKGDTTCIAQCEADRTSALKSCAGLCDACIVAACGSIPHDCNTIVGL